MGAIDPGTLVGALAASVFGPLVAGLIWQLKRTDAARVAISKELESCRREQLAHTRAELAKSQEINGKLAEAIDNNTQALKELKHSLDVEAKATARRAKATA